MTASRNRTLRPTAAFGLVLAIMAIFARPPALPASDTGQADMLCEAYGAIGFAVADFMLPMSLQQIVNMASGASPQQMEIFSANMQQVLAGPYADALRQAGPDAGGLFGQFGGDAAMGLLMQGRATSADQLRTVMIQQCNTVGSAKLLEDMRTARREIEKQITEQQNNRQ